ncbi:hypothetical protein EBZ80_12005 [bacterium]|nr:hypothetical protein [bacterium]
MNKMARGLSYLIAACFEAVAVIFGAALAARYLDANHPQGFRWLALTMPVGFLVICHTFYVVLRAIVRMDKETSATDGSQGGNKRS